MKLEKKRLINVIHTLIFAFLFSNCNVFEKFDKGTNPFVKTLTLLFIDRSTTTVTSVLPKDKSTGNVMNTSVYVVFSKVPSNLSTSNFTVSSDGGKTNQVGTVTITDKVGSFIPTGNFQANTTYTVTVTGGGISSPYTFTFSTNAIVDSTAPSVSNTNPSTGETGIPINATVTATLSETIAPNSFTSTSLTLTGGINGTVSLDDQTISFKPSGYYAANTTYAVTLKAGLKDLAGNAMTSTYSWTFTTGTSIGTSCLYDVSIFNTCFFE